MITKRILRVIIILFFLIEGIGCDSKTESEFHKQNGLVLYYGSPAVDGCGWVIQINKVDYSPVNLDENFQKSGLKVVVDYQILTSTFSCGDGVGRYQQIKIVSIK
jgi:hypothetical protein